MKKLLMLFVTFFKIGLFTFGGGYAMLSLIQSETVSKRQWLEADELLNIIAIAESTPGPIAINCATYIGYKRAGVIGSVFATLGVVLPSFLIIFAISFFIDEFLKIELVGKAFRGIQAAVAVLILRAGIKMAKGIKRDAMSLALIFLSVVVMITLNFVSFDFSSIYLIIFGGLVGVAVGIAKKSKTAPLATESEIVPSIGEIEEGESDLIALNSEGESVRENESSSNECEGESEQSEHENNLENSDEGESK